MVVTPDTIIKLVHLDVSKEHQLTFSNIQAQQTFFEGLNGLTLSASTYQRKEGYIRFEAWVDELDNYNYLYFNNPSYSNKYYYCYITRKEYVNDKCTNVYIKIDVFQTYQFDFIYRSCYVEREHVNNDTRGLHTVPENIETGEYIINSYEDIPELREKVYFVKVNKDTSGTVQRGTMFGDLYSGSGYYVCRTYMAMVTLLNDFETAGIPDAVISVYVAPYAFFNRTMQNVIEKAPDTNNRYIHIIGITKPTSIDGYTPTNKKLLTNQYCYLMVSNQSGGVYNYNYEDFKSTDCEFSLSAIPTEGCSGILTPLGYGTATGTEEKYFPFSLQAGKYPITDYNFDNYSIWLRNNMLNISLASLGSVAQAGLGIGQVAYGLGVGDVEAGLSGLGNVGSSLTRINSIAQLKYEKSKLPATTAGQVSNGDIMSAMNTLNFYFYKMSIKSEYARIIDNYFNMFGYKILQTKVPNITGRLNWNYVKTIGAIVDGLNVPEEAIKEYETMLNNGITFWHNPATLKDYSQSNTIVI